MISSRNFALVTAVTAALAVAAWDNPKSETGNTSAVGFPAGLRDSHAECGTEQLLEGLEPTSYPLGERRQLHMVPCWAGASLVFVMEDQSEEPQLLTFNEYLPDGKRTRTKVLAKPSSIPCTAC